MFDQADSSTAALFQSAAAMSALFKQQQQSVDMAGAMEKRAKIQKQRAKARVESQAQKGAAATGGSERHVQNGAASRADQQSQKRTRDGDDERRAKKEPRTTTHHNEHKRQKEPRTTPTSAVAMLQQRAKVPLPTPPPSSASTMTSLQQKMSSKLDGGRFRFLNEQLYTTTGREAFTRFQKEPHLFDEYHRGFRAQVAQWPQNPVDIYISQLRSKLKKLKSGANGKDSAVTTATSSPFTVVDLGCGEAKIAQALYGQRRLQVERTLRIISMDLVARNEFITAGNIAETRLPSESADVVIFCLALMGTDHSMFLKEAHRILKNGATLKIAEVQSRIDDLDAFVRAVAAIGFRPTMRDVSNKMFVMLEFTKSATSSGNDKSGPSKVSPAPMLKACIYKRR